MSRQAREERQRRSRPSAPRRSRRAASAALFLACFAAGLGAAAIVRGQQRRPRSGSSPASADGAGKSLPIPEEARRAEEEGCFQKGVEDLSAERFSGAFEAFTAASQMDPTDPRPHHGLGKIYDQLFLRDRAEQSYRRAVEADPRFRPSKEKLAMLLCEKGRHDEAVAILRELAKETPEDPFLWAELAINATATGRPGEAIPLLEKYNAVKGKQAWGYAHLGRAYEDAGLPDRAEAAYRTALSIDEHFALACYWLGHLLVATDRQAESEPLLQTHRRLQQLSTDEHEAKMALLADPRDVKALVSLSRARLLLGRPKESLATLNRALEIAPGDAKLLELREQVSRSARGPERARDAGER